VECISQVANIKAANSPQQKQASRQVRAKNQAIVSVYTKVTGLFSQ
jgi:hypothetical protein